LFVFLGGGIFSLLCEEQRRGECEAGGARRKKPNPSIVECFSVYLLSVWEF